MGSVLLGAMAGCMAAVIALFLGAGFWPAFMTYVVTGVATTCGVAVAVFLRPDALAPEFAGMPADMAPADTMTQWLDDDETVLPEREDTQSNDTRAA